MNDSPRTSFRGRRDRFGQPVPAGAVLRPVGRVLTCTRCETQIDVFEAAYGARTLAEHRHLDPVSYVGVVCGCLKPKPWDGEQPPAWTADAAGRARTGRQTATSREGTV